MTTKTAHTPLPWTHSRVWGSEIGISDHKIMNSGGKSVATDATPQDAALIVRAVNSHDALVAALEQIERLGRECDRNRIDVATMLSEIARAALAKANGE